jgi:3-isopropylmalate/(R)-2-methylmalate dehydratase large subunit
MTGQTITEKILARHAGKDRVSPGDTIESTVDTIMMHDVTSKVAIDIVNNDFNGRVADDLEIVVTPDHYVPNKDIKSAKLYQQLKRFVDKQIAEGANIRAYMVEGGDYGVCHVMLPEKGHVIPGKVIVGGDSHTCTYGAWGAFSTGIGSTEAGNVLATGKLWFRVPESMKVEVTGEFPGNVMAKDLFLRFVGDVGVDGAWYKAIELCGEAVKNMSMDERSTFCNMAIEAGAKSGIVAPDIVTAGHLINLDCVLKRSDEQRHKLLRGKFCSTNWDWVRSDADAQYYETRKYDVSGLEPLVACPDLPSNVKPASELGDIKIDQAYIGGCTGGKMEDFEAAAQILYGKRTARGVRLLIVPSTADIQRKMVRQGLYDTFMDAGAVFSAPTCGACLGGYMGILALGEVAISSTNRNFRGRMGDPESFVYLASPKTVAASAIAGCITGAKK